MSQDSNPSDFECLTSNVLNEVISFQSLIQEHFNNTLELQQIGHDVNMKLEQMFFNIQFELRHYQTLSETARRNAHNQANVDQEIADYLTKIQTLSGQISLHIAAMSQNNE